MCAGLSLSALALCGALTGCANDQLANQYRSGSGKQFVAGDGSVTEIAPYQRTRAVQYDVVDADGHRLTSTALRGRVVVVNFWYAACAPCRAEAPMLGRLSRKFERQKVQFIGANVRDGKATAAAFTQNFKLTYPTVLDTRQRSSGLLLAFRGTASANAVPTTLVIDRNGRVAARVLGEANESVLTSLISDTLSNDAASDGSASDGPAPNNTTSE